jgi:hypothetical protein
VSSSPRWIENASASGGFRPSETPRERGLNAWTAAGADHDFAEKRKVTIKNSAVKLKFFVAARRNTE